MKTEPTFISNESLKKQPVNQPANQANILYCCSDRLLLAA